MPVFSQVLINPRQRGARYVLGSLERMHAVIARAAAGAAADGNTMRPLWRLERRPAALTGAPNTGASGTDTSLGLLKLYVVSESQLDGTVLYEELGVTAGNVRSTDYQPFLDHLADGQRYVFRLKANVTKSTPSERIEGENRQPDSQQPSRQPRARGTRHGINDPKEQIAWLERQCTRAGAELQENRFGQPDVAIRWSGKETFRRKGKPVTLTCVVFDSILTVDNAENLRKALVDGIGRGKAYGCGLLTLTPFRPRS